MSFTHSGLRFSRLWWWLGSAIVALILFLSLMPLPPQPPVPISDKWQHAFAYALMMSWFAQLTPHHWRTVFLLVAMGIGVEFVQGWSGYRYYEVLDMLANSVGVLIGWAMYGLRIRYLGWLERLHRG